MGTGKEVVSPDAPDQLYSKANVELVEFSTAERYDARDSTQDKAEAEVSDCYPLMTKIQTNNELLENPASLCLR